MDLWQINVIPRDVLGQGSGVQVRFGDDSEHLAKLMAREMADVIIANNEAKRPTCLIVPVGPVGQFEKLARIVLEESIDCTPVTIINMDEFLDDSGAWISMDHPFSFRGFMKRNLYDRLPFGRLVRPENQVFPSPNSPRMVAEIIADRGGVDVCFGGIGLNGHIAYNEPDRVDVDTFAASTTRVVELAPESRAHMAVNLACSLSLIPRAAVTIGMAEILGSRRISLYANRHWQTGVIREMLHGPITSECPASLVRRHPNVSLTVSNQVAEPRELRLH